MMTPGITAAGFMLDRIVAGPRVQDTNTCRKQRSSKKLGVLGIKELHIVHVRCSQNVRDGSVVG